MAISYKSVLYDKDRAFTVAVDQYEKGCIEGVLYHGDCQTGMNFVGYQEFLRIMEGCFGQMQYPRPVMDVRSFLSVRNDDMETGRVESGRRSGRAGDFVIRVNQRQNASWQGVLLEAEREPYRFPSFLDLIMHLNQVLSRQPIEPSDEGVCQKQVEQYLKVVMECPDTLKILPDTLVYRFHKEGKKKTFMIRPMFYEHNTCQGTLYWKECKKQNNFRSFLELVRMMGTAVQDRSDWGDQEEAM